MHHSTGLEWLRKVVLAFLAHAHNLKIKLFGHFNCPKEIFEADKSNYVLLLNQIYETV